ncbi:MAG: alpha-amylase family glycosyl hydrolase [Candidatus Lokiarchaeota archaeon]|nr:alpha-amylase family glycosyl hydrolase [Candidatus Lokiarchaeota archaeon]
MKLSKQTRNQYQLEDFSFTPSGNVVFAGDIYSVRKFIQKINQKKDLIRFPELAFKTGHFNGMALIYKIQEHVLELYKNETESPLLMEDLFNHLRNKFNEKEIDDTLKTFIDEFPPQSVYNKDLSTTEFLNSVTGETNNSVLILEEFIPLWLGNNNPSFTPYLELFNDEKLEKETKYVEIIEEIYNFFEERPRFGPKNQNIIKMLEEPIKNHPHSIREQLEYLHENWGEILGNYSHAILVALDLIREEETFRGLGSGRSEAYSYDMLELENFTPDKEWMPKVVMIAKNTYVWLDQLSKKYHRSINKLNEIPDEELDQLKGWGFNALWLIGLWERSQASKIIKNWCGNPEAEASAYSLFDYVIAYDLGGQDAFENLKQRALYRGLRLASDMVPNHTGIMSKWMIEHPDWYVSLPYPPFPSYTYSGNNLSNNPNYGIFLEDKYFDRTDAAVTFKHVNYSTGETKYIYHGNDGTSFPWNDTAQLNFLMKEVRESVIQTILHVSRMFPIIRFDAAMTLTKKHYQRLWFPEPGTGGAIPSRAEHGIPKEDFHDAMPEEFWREVVNRINEKNPDTLLLAEAFWLLEGYFVRSLGMHRVYNSAFMNMLRDEDNAMYRLVIKNTLEFDPEILNRFVNFMNNPDEETAIKQFGDGAKYFGICIMMITMPGLPMFGHGQVEGFYEKYGMEYRRSYWNEEINLGLLQHHENIIFPLIKKRYLFAEVKNFLLYDFFTGDSVNEDVFAYSNKVGNGRSLVIYHNKYAETKGFIKNSVAFVLKDSGDKKLQQKTIGEGLTLPKDGYCIFKDSIMNLEYIRRNNDLHQQGLYVELHAYQTLVFLDFRIVQDNEFFHYAQLYDFLNGKGVHNIDETLTNIIYGPLHSPIEELVNEKILLKIINNKLKDSEQEKYRDMLNEFLLGVKKYSNSNKNIKPLLNEILNDVKSASKLDGIIKNYLKDDKITILIEEIFPLNTIDWGILYSWIVIHPLGKIVSNEDYELRSRSWIDEWYLSKYIQLILQQLKKDDVVDISESLALIKLLIIHQNWFNKIQMKEYDEVAIMNVFFKNPEVQDFLRFNRYQDILWFNAENFEVFTRWLSIIAIINLLSKGDDLTKSLQLLTNLLLRWRKTAKTAKYQVNRFLESLQSLL